MTRSEDKNYSEYKSWADLARDWPVLAEAACAWDRDCPGEELVCLVVKVAYENPRRVLLWARTTDCDPWGGSHDWCSRCGRWVETMHKIVQSRTRVQSHACDLWEQRAVELPE